MSSARVFLDLLLAFLAGVAIRSFLAIPPLLLWVGFLFAAVPIAIGTKRRSPRWILYGFLGLACLAGILRFDQVAARAPDLSGLYGERLVLEGFVAEDPQRRAQSQRMKFRAERVNGAALDHPFHTLITSRRYPEYELGDGLRVEGVLEKPEKFDDFDYASFLARQDIFSSLAFPTIERVGEGRGNRIRLWLASFKHALDEGIEGVLPEPHAAFLKGLLLGERESLPTGLVEDFRRTGTSHIVVLSGYNITLVGRAFLNFLLLLTLPFALAFWVALSGIVLFVLLTGASPSLVRAGIMGILVLVAQREGRPYQVTPALVVAAAAMVLHDPQILRFDAAFQLSFLATAGLVYLSPHVERWVDRVGSRPPLAAKPSGRIRQILIETLAAQLAVLPLLIYLFGRVSLVSPISNVLVLMAVPASMGVGFLAVVVGFLWQPLAGLVGWLSWALLEYMIRTIELFAKIPAASVGAGPWVLGFILLLYAWAVWRWFKRPRLISSQRSG